MTSTPVAQDHIGFKISRSSIRGDIFLPRYYDPEIDARLAALRDTHDHLVLGDLMQQGHIVAATGHEIGKMAYGTGVIPFVRTSDISNWEIKTDPKQGVSEEVYSEYGPTQDVQVGDILFVRDGTYLIGQVAAVTASDLPLLIQSHVVRFRVSSTSPVSPWLLMALLSMPIVKRQIRAKKFTADIIDTIGDRYRELVLPVPKHRKAQFASEVENLIKERARLRDKIRKIPFWVEGHVRSITGPVPVQTLDENAEYGNNGFLQKLSDIKNGIFIPRYYDPQLEAAISALEDTHDLVPISRLVEDGILSWDTGIEVGKMAYGTGGIPFIRTSDISNWELKGDPKQNVSEEIFSSNRQDVRAGDIFVVRDGTYLVGTSCILTENDTRILYCGGLYKLRIERCGELDPFLLLALLNSPIVRKQMRAKQFTRDVIDTLGQRLFEVVLPIPKNSELRKQIVREVRQLIASRAKLRDRTKDIARELEGCGGSEGEGA